MSSPLIFSFACEIMSASNLETISNSNIRNLMRISSPFELIIFSDSYRLQNSRNCVLTVQGVMTRSPKSAWSLFKRSFKRASEPLCLDTRVIRDAVKLTGETTETAFKRSEQNRLSKIEFSFA